MFEKNTVMEYVITPEKNLLWIITSTYYKHGDYETNVFSDKKQLSLYLKKEIQEYTEYDKGDHDYSEYKGDWRVKGIEFNEAVFQELILKACFYGNNHVVNQRGFGIRQIQTIKLLYRETKEDMDECEYSNRVILKRQGDVYKDVAFLEIIEEFCKKTEKTREWYSKTMLKLLHMIDAWDLENRLKILCELFEITIEFLKNHHDPPYHKATLLKVQELLDEDFIQCSFHHLETFQDFEKRLLNLEN